MSLLELAGVGKRYRSAGRERTVLGEIDLAIEPGDLVMVWGARRSGRSTLLRVAAGIERADTGTVRFEDQDVSEQTLGADIGYVAKTLRATEEQGVLEQVAAVLMARGVSVRDANERARAALARACAQECAAMRVSELDSGEVIRVAIARAIVLAPKLIVIDEPAATVEISQRDEVLAVLRTLTSEGVAVLASTGEPDQLAGADMALTLRDGRLHGKRRSQMGTVLPLRRGA
jgi:ABC-type lipoprotein export system ATPase subunit